MGQAQRIFAANATVQNTADTLWHYAPLNPKRRVNWNAISPHRSLLLDLFHATKGYLLTQLGLEKQLVKFVGDIHMKATEKQITEIAYRIRVMMSHLRILNFIILKNSLKLFFKL